MVLTWRRGAPQLCDKAVFLSLGVRISMGLQSLICKIMSWEGGGVKNLALDSLGLHSRGCCSRRVVRQSELGSGCDLEGWLRLNF